jgi:hypothetical protein
MALHKKRIAHWTRFSVGIASVAIAIPEILDLVIGGQNGTMEVLRNPTHFHGFEVTSTKFILAVFPIPVILGIWLICTAFSPTVSRFRFGLKSLLVFITLMCFVLAWIGTVIRTDWARY